MGVVGNWFSAIGAFAVLGVSIRSWLIFIAIVFAAVWIVYEWWVWDDLTGSAERNNMVYAHEYHGFLETFEKLEHDVAFTGIAAPRLDTEQVEPDLLDFFASIHRPITDQLDLMRIKRIADRAKRAFQNLISQANGPQGGESSRMDSASRVVCTDVCRVVKKAHEEHRRLVELEKKQAEKQKRAQQEIRERTEQKHQLDEQKKHQLEEQKPEYQQKRWNALLLNGRGRHVYVQWMPRIFNSWLMRYQERVERDWIAAGFKKSVYRGVDFFVNGPDPATYTQRVKSMSTTQPPILILHGISPLTDWLQNISARMGPERTILFPRNPTLTASSKTVYKRGEIMTVLQYVRSIKAYCIENEVRELCIGAWSFGGLAYNYLTVEAALQPTIEIRGVVLIEPMGFPTTNAIGSTYNLLPFHEAMYRAWTYAPAGRLWHHMLFITWLRTYLCALPMKTEPAYSAHSQGAPGAWGRGVKLLASGADALGPTGSIEPILKRPEFEGLDFVILPGEHGTWPYRKSKDPKEDFLEICFDWFDVPSRNARPSRPEQKSE